MATILGDSSPPRRGGARPGAGRPRKEHLDSFKKLVEATVSPTDFQEMVRAMVTKAKEGDTRAFAQIMDRYYGKATEHVITESVGDQAAIKIVFEEKQTGATEE